MKFCSECGKEIALLDFDKVEKYEGKIYCQQCAKKLNEEDLLLIR